MKISKSLLTLWSPWFIQINFSIVRVKGRSEYHQENNEMKSGTNGFFSGCKLMRNTFPRGKFAVTIDGKKCKNTRRVRRHYCAGKCQRSNRRCKGTYANQLIRLRCEGRKSKFKLKCLFFKPHMDEYKRITVNVLHKTYNITHINV